MYWINEDVAFVKGARNGAIYDLVKEKVYSVNSVGCDIIERYIERANIDKDFDYIRQLENNELVSPDFAPTEIRERFDADIRLEMAWIEITQTCNMKCLHCYEGDVHKSDADVLNVKEWKSVVEQLAAQNINRLIIIGGEPGCHKNLGEIMEYASQYQFKTILFTNASLLSKELMDCIIKNNIIVKVSVYGNCAEVHDRITNIDGSFEKLSKTVKYLVDNGVHVEAAIIIMHENQTSLNETIEFVKSIGMHYKKYDVIREVYGGMQNEHIPTDSDLINRVSLTRPNFCISKKKFFENQNRNTCWYGKITILENGDVVPCEFERNIIYGNIRKNSINEILNSSSTKEGWFWDFSKIEKCQDCEYRYACKDCRPLGKAVCGSMTTRNPRCCYDVYNGTWETNKWKNDDDN